jgi:hypothetical protein
MITEKHVRDAADVIALQNAAQVLQRRSRKPGSFWLRVICRFLERTADDIRNGKGNNAS